MLINVKNNDLTKIIFIGIRQLQCILLKVSLILGVEIHEGVSFDSLSPPPNNDESMYHSSTSFSI